MMNDPHIDQIRKVRHELSNEVGHDLHKMKSRFTELEERFAHAVIDYGARRTTDCARMAGGAALNGNASPSTR